MTNRMYIKPEQRTHWEPWMKKPANPSVTASNAATFTGLQRAGQRHNKSTGNKNA